MNREPFYDHDLALIHDLGHSAFAATAAPAIIAMLGQHGVTAGRILDLGCGSGALATPLIDAGYDVAGVDVSGPMLELAGQNEPRASFIRGSLHDVDLPPAAAAVSVGECFNYINAAPDHALPRLLERIALALEPSGVLVFDMALTGRGGPTGTTQTNRLADDWAVLSTATEEDAMLTRRITTFVRDGESFRRRDEVHRLALPNADDVLDALRAAGFSARTCTYDGVTFPPGYGAFIGVRA